VQGARARELVRLTAVGSDLLVDASARIVGDYTACEGGVTDEQRQGHDLGIVPRSVIVRLAPFVAAVGAREQPVEIRTGPRDHRIAMRAGPPGCVVEQPECVDELRHVTRIDDSNAPAFGDARNGLREAQVRIHSCRGVDEPGVEQSAGVLAIACVAGEEVGEGEALHGVDHRLEANAVVIEPALGIHEPIAPDVRHAPRFR
jgi:hypothetical protein